MGQRALAETKSKQLRTVMAYGKRHLGSLRRRSGESYAHHCREVANVLGELSVDPVIIPVALLHDLLIHPNGEELLTHAPITQEQRDLIREMHKLRRLHIDTTVHDLDAALAAFVSDPRLLPLRMAHRLNDVRHLHRFPLRLQRLIAREALHMYAAIAGRLGMHAWRHEIEDRSFMVVYPEQAKNLQHTINLHRKNDDRCLRDVAAYVRSVLTKNQISHDVTTRRKTLYSTYRKMVLRRRRFDELTDRLALRIVVPTAEECYRALGVIHGALHPMPGKLKDYIGAPKENGYRSIHTVVFPMPGISEYPVEVQIRSRVMHEECEYGLASHAEYKHALYAFRSRLTRVDLFRNLLTLRASVRSPVQFGTALRTYFDDRRFALFDHANNLYHLPQPLSALDFACLTQPSRMTTLRAIRVNGRAAPLDVLLRDGDTVQCLYGRQRIWEASCIGACRQRESRRLLRALMSGKLQRSSTAADTAVGSSSRRARAPQSASGCQSDRARGRCCP